MQPVTGHDACAGAAPRWVGGCYPLFVSRGKQHGMMTCRARQSWHALLPETILIVLSASAGVYVSSCVPWLFLLFQGPQPSSVHLSSWDMELIISF